MIQRIQTVYLLLTAILMAVTVFSPIVGLQDQLVYLLNGFGCHMSDIAPAHINYLLWISLAFSAVATLISLFNIFSFKNRKRQIKLCKTTSLLIVLLYVILAIYLFWVNQTISIGLSSLKYGFVLPLIALILNLLASSKIKSDEKLVQSLNRIR